MPRTRPPVRRRCRYALMPVAGRDDGQQEIHRGTPASMPVPVQA